MAFIFLNNNIRHNHWDSLCSNGVTPVRIIRWRYVVSFSCLYFLDIKQSEVPAFREEERNSVMNINFVTPVKRIRCRRRLSAICYQYRIYSDGTNKISQVSPYELTTTLGDERNDQIVRTILSPMTKLEASQWDTHRQSSHFCECKSTTRYSSRLTLLSRCCKNAPCC